MSHNWIIAPAEANPSDVFEKVWEFDLREQVISIGFTRLGDVSSMSQADLTEIVAAKYSEKPLATQSLYKNMMWSFYRTIAPGDLIVARRGRKRLVAIGEVIGAAYYAAGKNPYIDHPNFLPVSWKEQPRDLRYPTVVFPMHTLAEAPREKVDKLISGMVVDPPSEVPETTTADPNVFVLEKYLEEFIVSNFQKIFGSDITIYKDSEGNEGQQYSTDIGPIDILAIDENKNCFVVIELKKGRPSDQVVGQVLRYMGWVKEHICNTGQSVRGLIICREQDKKLTYALKTISNVNVRYYEVDFKLNES